MSLLLCQLRRKGVYGTRSSVPVILVPIVLLQMEVLRHYIANRRSPTRLRGAALRAVLKVGGGYQAVEVLAAVVGLLQERFAVFLVRPVVVDQRG